MSLEGRVIGVIEDDAIMGESLVQSLGLAGSRVHWWTSGRQAIAGVRENVLDLVVCDIRLPDTDGGAVFRELAKSGHVPPFLFMTAYGSIDEAVALIRAGGGDYVTKPFAMEEFIDRANALISLPGRSAQAGALGISEAMRRVEAMLMRVAARPTPVLLLGETGVGKEVCARFLHQTGLSAGRPFIAVNCAAIPSELMESEIFGHEKGAFSGAVSLHRGYAERAGDGTMFLDEVCELPLAMQAKLLRLLEERRFTRVGGEQSIPFKARIVCATNTDLEKAVASGRFREDLYYRINVVAISIPPLASRKDDIKWLIRRFLDELGAEIDVAVPSLTALAEQAVLEHTWPGNVRELRNRLERAVLMASGPSLMPGDLFPESGMLSDARSGFVSLRSARDEAERRQIERAVRKTGGQIGEAARILGVSRTTLWEKMKRYGIVAPDDE
jgi:DNA-binding NtrC family response regulator